MASQCTFWCSVLSDSQRLFDSTVPIACLNAPFGAQCFPTALAFGPALAFGRLNAPFGAQCFPTNIETFTKTASTSQCTFWCSVLSDAHQASPANYPRRVSMHLLVLSAFRHRDYETSCDGLSVSMHLLVLSAFRPDMRHERTDWNQSQCTFWCSVLSDEEQELNKLEKGRLNAPFGAQCFPTI